MAAVTIQVIATCAGGDHVTVKLTKDAQVRNVQINIHDVRDAITQEEIDVFARVAIKLRSEGRTLAQFRTSMNTGFTVTI